MIIWDCGYCGTTNPPMSYRCDGCGHLRMKEFERSEDYNLTPNINEVRFHERSPFPSNPYYFDGGVSLRSSPDMEAVWK